MPKVTVQQKSKLSASDAFKKVKTLLDSDPDLKKLDGAYKCDFDDSKMTGQATGKLFKAAMNVKGNGSGSEIEIVVDLPLALTLAKGMVEKILSKKLAALS
jgi:hypothetical protein